MMRHNGINLDGLCIGIPHAIIPASGRKGSAEDGYNLYLFKSPETIKSVKKLVNVYLCEGKASPCETCTVRCRYGARYLELKSR